MTHPVTILNALPTAGNKIPQNARDAYLTAGNQPVRIFNALPGVAGGGTVDTVPTSGVSVGAWGLIGGGNYATACQVNDGDTTCIQSADLTPLNAVQIGMAKPADPGTNVGWSMNFIMRKTLPAGIIGCDIVIDISSWNGLIFTQLVILFGQSSYIGPNAGGLALTESYALYTVALDAGDAAAIRAMNPADYVTAFFQTRTNAGDLGTFDNVIRITQMYLQSPGVPGTGLPPNIENALPATGALVPQNVLDALPT